MKASLLILFLLISIVGIFLLLLLSNFIEPRLIKIKDIDDSILNKNIKIQGTITNIRSYEESNFQVISIKDETEKIDITTNQILNLKTNQTIIVTGKVQEYKQNLQIQADKIILK